MTTVTAAMRADLGFVSIPNRQTDAENQQQAWLRQMEQEQMMLLEQPSQQPKQSSAQHGGKDTDSNENGEVLQHAAKGTSTETLSANLLPVHPILSQTIAAQKQPLLMQGAALTGAINPMSDEMSVLAEGAQALTMATMEQTSIAVSEPTVISVNPISTALVSIKIGAEEGTPANRSEQPSKSFDDQFDAANTEWQKRMMHVSQEGNDISVSIRDATLSVPQSMHVVARLASDAVQSGLRLKQATVNGKAIIKADAANSNPSQVAEGRLEITTPASNSETKE